MGFYQKITKINTLRQYSITRLANQIVNLLKIFDLEFINGDQAKLENIRQNLINRRKVVEERRTEIAEKATRKYIEILNKMDSSCVFNEAMCENLRKKKKK